MRDANTCGHRPRLTDDCGVCVRCYEIEAYRAMDAEPKPAQPAQAAPFAFADWYAGKDADAFEAGRRAGIEQAAAVCDDRRDQHEAAHMRAGNYTSLAMTDAWAKEAGRCAAAIRALLLATDGAEEKTDA